MKKNLLLLATSLLSATALADSYTLTFNDSGSESDGNSVIKVDGSAAVDSVLAEGAEYVSSFGITSGESTTRTYFAKQGFGLKFGNSSKGGNITFYLTAKGKVKADSLYITAAAYGSDTPKATLNDSAINVTGNDLATYKVIYSEPTQLDSIYVGSTAKGRIYATSIQVFYTAEAESFDSNLAHAPHYTEGKIYENVLGPDMIAYKVKTVDGAEQSKPAIADRFAWIEYINPTSTLDDGSAEVQTSNRWTNMNPSYDDYNYGEGGNWLQITNAAGSVISPVLSSAWGKYMIIYVQETSRIEILGIGSASGSADDGNNIQVTATAQDNSEILEFASTPGKIYGKGSSSDTCVVTLDPEKAYKVVIKGNETVNKDIMVGNIRLYGTSTVVGPAIKDVTPTYAYADIVVGPDMIVKGGTKVKTTDGTTSDKYGIDDNLKWIEYINPTSVLDDGTAEVQASNRWTDLNPRTDEKGTWLQVAGQDGDVYAPVISSAWGKYLKFYITGTKKFTAYATGSGGKSADDGNRLIMNIYPFNSNDSIELATEAGTIYGKGNGSDLLSADLDETETYLITLKGDPVAQKDIQLLGIKMLDSEGEAYMAAGTGTLNIAIEKALAAGADSLVLDSNESYTLNGIAAVGLNHFTLVGDNTGIVADSIGQITTKDSLSIEGVNITATSAQAAVIALADKSTLTAADTTALYTYGYAYGTAAVYYTQEECDAYNTENADAIAAGTLWTLTTDSVKTAATEGYKYNQASNKMLEAKAIVLKNSQIKVSAPLVSLNNATWALNSLVIDNVVAELTYKSGKAIINGEEENTQIKDFNLSNSTIYCDSANSEMRFIRYKSQVDPWRIWGYEGEDKNAPGINTITITNSTLVNTCGSKEFANNIKNSAATTLTLKGNIFANCFRLQKLGGNLTNNTVVTDNAIFGGNNPVDATDASKYATVDSIMGIAYNDSVQNFVPSMFSYAAQMQLGDPRWLDGVVYVNPADSLKALISEADALLTAADAITTLAEYTTLSTEKATGEAIVNAETFYSYTAVQQIGTLAAAIQAYQTAFTSGISDIAADQKNGDAVMYNLMGQRVNEAKGIVIINGRKIMKK
ncbi:MAG: hypothetical protein K6E86_03550 [Bacteroidales bacterium]|nr:hypothetical protein [Bacteroidales bacterium]